MYELGGKCIIPPLSLPGSVSKHKLNETFLIFMLVELFKGVLFILFIFYVSKVNL